MMATATGLKAAGRLTAREALVAFFAEAEENYRALVQMPKSAIVATDDLNRVFFWSDSAEKLFGRPRRTVIDRPFAEAVEFGEEAAWRNRPDEAGLACNEFVSTIKSADGRFIPVSVCMSARKSPAGWLGTYVIRDISEERRYENEMARLSGLGLVGQMAAAMGHEVRNPLTTVRGFLQLLRRKDGLNQEYYDMMIEEIDRADAIISQYLSLSRCNEPLLSRESLAVVVGGMRQLLTALALEHGKFISMAIEDAPLPAVLLDNQEVKQLVLNLVRNALEASPPGGAVTVSVRTAVRAVVLAVRDNGTGIPVEIMDKLGTPFLTTKPEGNGLGLAVCYRIADRHKAMVEVESQPGRGTEFSIYFPLAD